MPEAGVHVIDDDADAREALAFLLSTADLSVESYASAAAFLAVATEASGVVVTDVRMPDIDGMALMRRLAVLGARLPVIVMTGHGDVPLAVAAMKAGAFDFLEKPYDGETMLAAVRAGLARHGEAQARDGARAGIAQRIAELSPRQRQVLEGLVAGKANKVIARDLDISPRTVEIYRANVMARMQAQSLSELVRMAVAAGAA